ncbi:MAG: 3-oxoacyl-[acyl-carrier-protein] synthase III C-terminal domain-containing protein [Kouleothrix sp.]
MLVDGDAASTGRPDAGCRSSAPRAHSGRAPPRSWAGIWSLLACGWCFRRAFHRCADADAAKCGRVLAQHQLTIDDIDHWVLHPGGAKVVGACSALAIDRERLSHTRAVLRDYGNMSSATVFFVLDAFLKAGAPGPGEYGVLAVLGPGFSCELALVRG